MWEVWSWHGPESKENSTYSYMFSNVWLELIPQSHLLYGGRTVAVELQNRVIPAVAVEILRWPQGHRTANPYVLKAAGVAVEL